ncbi:hypothetical protein Pcaca04_03640 [Pectobacterium carotovorum subsp. carotovorum]|nr:hypothetical protein EGD00_17830 [Pectobacterium carotovorum subsp. carotovorum]GLW36428.1 hypothetical protein Pcaca04_03640 [Pectobacterium carotovorum subsp. carotovorum]
MARAGAQHIRFIKEHLYIQDEFVFTQGKSQAASGMIAAPPDIFSAAVCAISIVVNHNNKEKIDA